MATTSGKTKAAVVASAQQLIAGTAKHLGNGATFLGGSYTAADLTTKLQQVVSVQSDVDAANAAAKAKLATQKTAMASLRPFIGAYKTYVKAIYGSQPDVLADFGLHPTTRATPTVLTKAAAAAKRASTRAARGTKGSVEKLAIKGDVTSITVTPVASTASVAPATPTGPTAGAPSPAPTTGATPHAATTTS
jgi:hypothetical protein